MKPRDTREPGIAMKLTGFGIVVIVLVVLAVAARFVGMDRNLHAADGSQMRTATGH
jgi:hypothetical protein